jgi:iron complex outermembrane receptor protein
MAFRSDLHLIAGTKVEHNDFTGGEVQPSLRLRWSPNEHQTFWGGVSRAVRTPSRGERDVRVILPNAALPAALLPEDVVVGFAALVGDMALHSEELIAWETGIRLLPTSWLLLDATAFVHVYDGLRSIVPGTPYRDDSEAAPMTILPASFDNDMDGTGRGLEVSVDGRLSESTRLQVHYSFVDLDLKDPLGTSAALEEGNVATTQWFSRASVTLTPRLTADVTGRYVSKLTAGVDAYTEADVRFGYSINDDVELELVLTNLLADRHSEILPASLHSEIAEVQRGARLGVTWRP